MVRKFRLLRSDSNYVVMKLKLFTYSLFSLFIVASCQEMQDEPGAIKTVAVAKQVTSTATSNAGNTSPVAENNAASILAKKEIPILCYHQLREYRGSDSKTSKAYIVPPAAFREQMKLLHDSGYSTILPDQLQDYLLRNQPIPEKSVMLTFDDTDLSQFEVAKAELKKYGYQGVFFIMTVSINRPGYMTAGQIRELSDDGHVIGLHTWDHHNVKKYGEADWPLQIEKPKKRLEEIAGKQVKYFAYPFGLWNEEAIPELQKRGISAAYQLSTRRDSSDPLYTIRRIIVPGSWSGKTMDGAMKRSFTGKL